MELQAFGVIMDFLGAVILLLFSDPVIMTKRNPDGKEVMINERIVRDYRIKRYIALFIIFIGFTLQIISLII